MRWTSKPEWAPILVAALAGALLVPFIPLVNALLKRTLLFIPAGLFTLSGMLFGVLVGIATWRLMMAGIVQVTEQGIVLVRYERNLLLSWQQLDAIEMDQGRDGKAKLILKDGTTHSWGFLRTPREDFLRMRSKIADPVLILPEFEREAAARALLEEHARDDLILLILRTYAGIIGFMGVLMSCVI